MSVSGKLLRFQMLEFGKIHFGGDVGGSNCIGCGKLGFCVKAAEGVMALMYL